MDNKLGAPSSKNKFLVLASVLLLLLVVLLVLLVSRRGSTPKVADNQNTPLTTIPQTNQEQNVVKATAVTPQVTFGAWSGLQAPATPVTSASVYTLKTEFTQEEVNALATKLGVTGSTTRDQSVVTAYGLNEDGTEASLLAFDLGNGNFAYNSNKGVAVTGATAEDRALQFLRNAGVFDTTLKVTATYKSKKHPDMIFVEVHRDWTRAGLPILNPVGLLNLPETQQLSSMTLASKAASLPEDPDIFATTDKKDGFARQDDFNTVTVGFDTNGQRVMMAKSTIRPLATAAPTTAAVLSFEQAVAKLKGNQYETLLTSPSGDGAASAWDKVYPGNKAEADTAVVTESLVAYLEQNPAVKQETLSPYYLFRGYANLTSGYRVSFLATVPAVETSQPRGLFPFIKQVFAQDVDTGQKQETFGLTPQPNNSVGSLLTPGAPLPVITGLPVPPVGSAATDCKPSVYEMDPIIEVGGLKFGYTIRPGRGVKEWYYLPESSVMDAVLVADLDRITQILNAGNGGTAVVPPAATTAPNNMGPTVQETASDDTGQKQSTFNVPTLEALSLAPRQVSPSELQIRKFEKIIDDIKKQADYCPVRLTGSSPSIFVYAPAGTVLSIKPGMPLTYADPGLNSAENWTVRSLGDTIEVNGSTRDYIYYEYSSVDFNKPSKGWIVKKSDLENFVDKKLSKLGLNTEETGRVLFELNQAVVDSTYLFIGLIDQNEVNTKVPLTVPPASKLSRYHFYVSAAAAGDKANAPQLSPINRSGVSIVEFGSHQAQ